MKLTEQNIKLIRQIDRVYSRRQFLSSDPLEFPHQYQDPLDQEAVALVSALLAYGNIKQIRRSVGNVLERIKKTNQSPRKIVVKINQNLKWGHTFFSGFVHRFNTGRDLALLGWCLGESWKKFGSLGGHFLYYLSPKDLTIEKALNLLMEDWRLSLLKTHEASVPFLLTSPNHGSTCKRWCMFLRWMGRKDDLDLGLWMKNSPLKHTFPKNKFLKSSQLIMPLDTHTSRMSQVLGLTQRKTVDWRMAVEVTEQLKLLSPKDPIRYDFALARPGILKTLKKEGLKK